MIFGLLCLGCRLVRGDELQLRLRRHRRPSMAFPHDWHRGVLADSLDAIEHDRDPRVSGAEALKVHRFIDALLR
jgi:predicted dehydrogenase